VEQSSLAWNISDEIARLMNICADSIDDKSIFEGDQLVLKLYEAYFCIVIKYLDTILELLL
jgi:hypothetical protein